MLSSLVPALLVLSVRLAYIGYTELTYEDAFISLRYAENFAHGHGLIYNPGERVFGATTPLYVLLLSFFAMLKLEMPLLGGKLVCALADAATTALWHRSLKRDWRSPAGAWCFALLFGLSPFIVEVSCSGMETSLVLLGATVAFLAAEAGRWALLGVSVGLLALVRLDTLLLGGLLFLYRGLRSRTVPWREAAIVAACLAPWVLFAASYYGTVIPNSIPAKMAAYQAHQPSIVPNLKYTWSFFAPFRNGWKEELFNAVVASLFLLGCRRIRADGGRWWPVPAMFLAHWAFLVFSRSVLFRWYYPPALLPFYVTAAIGVGALARGERVTQVRRHLSVSRLPANTDEEPPQPPNNDTVAEFGEPPQPPNNGGSQGHRSPGSPHYWGAGGAASIGPSQRASGMASVLLVLLLLHSSYWLSQNAIRARSLQRLEEGSRREIGLWLRENTPPGAVVCTEPIGYIGYYSQRRILDEVGLVSPRMVPINRQGHGWFVHGLQAFRPEYVVERRFFMAQNRTINVPQVRMFADAAQRDWFERAYRPVRRFGDDAPLVWKSAYGFTLFERRKNVKSSISPSTTYRVRRNRSSAGNSRS